MRSAEERIKRAVRSGEAAHEMWMAPWGSQDGWDPKPGIAQPGAVCRIKLRLCNLGALDGVGGLPPLQLAL